MSRRTPLYLWTGQSPKAAAALAACARHEIVEIHGRLRAAIWRRGTTVIRTLAVECESVKSLGFLPFLPRHTVTRQALKAKKEAALLRAREAVWLSEMELEKRTEKILDTLKDPI